MSCNVLALYTIVLCTFKYAQALVCMYFSHVEFCSFCHTAFSRWSVGGIWLCGWEKLIVWVATLVTVREVVDAVE